MENDDKKLNDSIRGLAQSLRSHYVIPRHVAEAALANPLICVEEPGLFDLFLDEYEYKKLKSLMSGVKWEEVDLFQLAELGAKSSMFPANYLNPGACLYYFPAFSLAACMNPRFAIEYLKFYSSHFVDLANRNIIAENRENITTYNVARDAMMSVLCKIEFSSWNAEKWRPKRIYFDFSEFLTLDFFGFCASVKNLLNDSRYSANCSVFSSLTKEREVCKPVTWVPENEA